MRVALAATLLCALSVPAFAAGNVTSSGQLTPGHSLRISTAGGVVSDGGGAAGSRTFGAGYLTELGITNTGTPLCVNDALISGPYHQVCFGASATELGQTGYYITANGYGGAAALPLIFNINGSNYQFPGNGQGNILGPNTSVIGDIVVFNNTAGTLVADSGISFPIGAAGGGTGRTTLTAHGILIGEGASAVNVTAAMTAGQLLFGQGATSDPAPETMSGDCTIASSGAIVCTKTTPVVTAKTANYTIASADCGAVISTKGNAQWTLTFPAASSVPTGCTIKVSNDDPHAKIIAGVTSSDSNTYRVYPDQVLTFVGDGTNWVSDGPRRYLVTGGLVYVGVTGCDDSNDGLASATPFCHIQNAITRLQQDFDSNGAEPQVQLADATYVEQVTFAGKVPGGADGIQLLGNVGTPSNVKVEAPNVAGDWAISGQDGGTITIKNMEIACPSGGGGTGIFARQYGIVDLETVIVGSCDGSNALVAQDSGHINVGAGLTVSGNAGALFYGQGTGSLITAGGGQTITCTGSPTMSAAFLEVTALAEFSTEGSTLVFSGCGGVVGQLYIVNDNAVAETSGSTMPGTVPGAATTGGIYN